MVVLALLIALMAACNTPPPEGPPPSEMPEDMPADLHIRSDYFGQPVAPVYHYDYFIILDPATTDTISFHPDYMESNPPVWIETYNAADSDLEDLWDLMVNEDIFREEWSLRGDTLVGAWTRTLHIRAQGESYNVPPWIQDTTSANPVYRRVDALVPGAIWDSLWTWRERYISGDTTSGPQERAFLHGT
jgi:hypothetical protein